MSPRKISVGILALAVACFGAARADLTQKECEAQGGILHSLTDTNQEPNCPNGKNLGRVTDVRCFCFCCSGEEIQDCSKHKIEIKTLCHQGDEIRYELTPQGTDEIERVLLYTKRPHSDYQVALELPGRSGTTKGAKGHLATRQPLSFIKVFFRSAPRPCDFSAPKKILVCPAKPH